MEKKALFRRILAGALILFAVFYLLYHVLRSFREPATLFAVRPYTAYDTQSFTGYLFKDEILLETTAHGARNYACYDGEKVAAGGDIADIYRAENDELEAELLSLRKQAELLREADRLGAVSSETLDEEIAAIYAKLSQTASNDSLSDRLLVLLAKKKLLESGETDFTEEIKSLEAQRAALALSLGTVADHVTAPVSGIFYSYSDGLSELFNGEAARTLTPARYDALVSLAQSASDSQSDTVVGTLLTEYRWYYACRAEQSAAEGFKVGDEYVCTFPDNRCAEEIRMTLDSMQADSDGVLLVFTTLTVPSDFDMTRCQRMEAVRTVYSGYRIPAECVRVQNGVPYVYIFKEGAARPREIEILFEQDGYLILSETYEGQTFKALALNDLVIVGERDLYDGKIID